MRSLRIARQAYADMDAIANYIAQDSAGRAECFVFEITTKIEQIVERPMSFPEKAEWSPGPRSALHGDYLILFRCDDTAVSVIRVIHGARDISGMFKGDKD